MSPPQDNLQTSQPLGLGLLTLAGGVMLGLLDVLMGESYSLRLLFVPMVMVLTWTHGVPWGVAGAVFFSLLAPLEALGTPNGNPFAPELLWEALMRAVTFLTLVGLIRWKQTGVEKDRSLARTDFLTELLNKRGFEEHLEAERNRTMRFGQPLTLVYLDCDGFKNVNDRLGHAEGDRVLNMVGKCLRNNTRSYDVLARLGGDEFALLFPNTNSEVALRVIPRLQDRLREEMRRHDWPVTFSIGVVTFYTGNHTLHEMLQLADRQMYHIKHTDKDGTSFLVINDNSPEEVTAGIED